MNNKECWACSNYGEYPVMNSKGERLHTCHSGGVDLSDWAYRIMHADTEDDAEQMLKCVVARCIDLANI